MPDEMIALVVYGPNQVEHPGLFVVRGHAIKDGKATPSPEAKTFHTLEDARASVPSGKARFARSASDDPSIIETWF